MSKASSPPPWARIALTWASMISASRVCCAVNGIDACLLASPGIRHVLRDGFHSVHAMLYGMSHTKVLCRKAPAASRVSPFTLSRTRYHGSQQHLIRGKRVTGSVSCYSAFVLHLCRFLN